MKRRELLELGLTEEKNVSTLVANVLTKDTKFIKKAKRDLDDAREEAEEALEERLASNIPLDKSVVEVLYAKIKDLKATTALYEAFEKEILAD